MTHFDNDTPFQVVLMTAAIAITFNLLIVGAGIWLVGSAVTSGIKAGSDSCGTHYSVPVVSQDWFCPEQ